MSEKQTSSFVSYSFAEQVSHLFISSEYHIEFSFRKRTQSPSAAITTLSFNVPVKCQRTGCQPSPAVTSQSGEPSVISVLTHGDGDKGLNLQAISTLKISKLSSSSSVKFLRKLVRN